MRTVLMRHHHRVDDVGDAETSYQFRELHDSVQSLLLARIVGFTRQQAK
ncbi:hypothetical protein I547_4826 [Mycobacterium kansasii 824]|nr:hypothetical protein I547_4826 [Mycobacterium kansasii 824]